MTVSPLFFLESRPPRTVHRRGGTSRFATAQPSAPPEPRHAASDSGLSYMPSLDGIRAFAVLGVMAYHGGIGFMSGGFLGVDTFFVLSGFLITTLLIGEWSSTAAVRLGAFWARRARRLLPALLLMLLFVAFFAYFIAPRGTYPGLRSDAFFTIFYTANWHFIASGANYFVANGPVSPLTHTWSLAVEEQFYLIWPLVVLGIVRLTRGNTVRALKTILVVSVAGSIASACAMALLYTGSNDTRLYYGTDTHAQCILMGAALAAILALVGRARRERGTMPGPRRIAHLVVGGDPAWAATSRNLRVALSLLGMAGLAVSVYLWTTVQGDGWWIYHGGFMVAALATGCVLTSVVCVQRGALARLLGLPPLRFLGRISYGMYLWHFPLFVWLSRERTHLQGWTLFGARVLVTVVVATASYYVVEQPIRQGTLMRGKRSLVLTPAAMAGVATVIVLATVPIGGGSALALGTGSTGRQPSVLVHASHGTQNVLLVGDSMAETLGNGIEGKVGDWFGLNIINDGVPDCSLAMGSFDVQAWPPHLSAPPCQAGSGDPGWPTDWTNLLTQYNPKVSIFLGRLDIVSRLFDGEWTHIGDPAYDQYLLGQMRLAVQVLTSHGGKVVFMTTPYYSTGEQPDGQPWPEDNPVRVDLYNSMLRQVVSQNPGRAFLFDLNKLADPSGHFQFDIDGVDVRFIDGIHWTYQGDCWLAPRVLPVIKQLADGIDSTPPAEMSTLVKHAEGAFPTTLCHAPT